VDYSASIQAVDLATGKVFSQQRIAVAPSLELASDEGQPEYPSETEVRELAIQQAKTQVHRMLLPWSETRKLTFYDDREYGMKEAYKRLKLKDVLGALRESEQALAKAKADTKVRAKFLGRTNYNVGICHFIQGDYTSAMPYLRAARQTDSEHKIFLEAANECERAIQLSEEMARVEKRSVKLNPGTPGSAAPPPANPGGSVEERLERLNNLWKKGLITQQEYDKRKAEILSEL
jgi:tetratricopeptide (TPR) repeat protein